MIVTHKKNSARYVSYKGCLVFSVSFIWHLTRPDGFTAYSMQAVLVTSLHVCKLDSTISHGGDVAQWPPAELQLCRVKAAAAGLVQC